MFSLFKKKPAQEVSAVPVPPAPVTNPTRTELPSSFSAASAIPYQGDLIGQLKDDHQAQLASFASIKQAYAEKQFTQLVEELDRFRAMVQAHLLVENVRLYSYLEQQMAVDPANHQLIKEFRHEMSGIGRDVMGFLGKYREMGNNPALVKTFGTDFEKIGQVLVDRIQREEKALYSLYLPAY
jgi:hypothetical protein